MVTTYIGIVRKGKVEFDQPLALPEGSQVQVRLSPVLSERAALAKANVWLATHVGDVVGAMKGSLIQGHDRALWRFEAFITGVQFDPLGPIGQVEVDAETGQVVTPSQTAEAMIEHGRHLTPSP